MIVDDFSRFTWTFFIVTKNDAFGAFKRLVKVIQNEKNFTIAAIETNHEGEFQNEWFERFCENFGIKQNFSTCKNFGRTCTNLINKKNLPKYFLANVVNTTCYVLKRVLIRPILKKTPYEIFKGRNPNVSQLKFLVANFLF